MLHLAHRSAAHDVGPKPSLDSSTGRAPNHTFISTQEVIFKTAAAAAVTARTAHRHSAVATLLGAISHIHVKLPEPHPIYQRANYFDAGRMSRLMEHL